MAWLCRNEICSHPGRFTSSVDGGRCSKCGRPFHQDCFGRHNVDKHGGKATLRELPEMDLFTGVVG